MGSVTDAVNTGLTRLRSGDPNALTDLIFLYQHRLYRYLVRITADPAAAEDLFQETWLRVSENIRHYDPNRSFDHWLFSVAHNLAMDHLRRKHPEALDEKSIDRRHTAAQALDRLLEHERASQVTRAIAELPATYREVLTLRFNEDMKLDEIASATGAPLPTVKTRLKRALQIMREKCAPEKLQ